MRCKEGKSYEFILTVAEGWRIHTVTFNGVDVTSELGADHAFTTPALQENSTLNVAFELESAAAVQKLGGSPVTVRGYNEDLLIEGAQYGDDIKVYTVDGAMIAADQATGASMQIRVAHQPVYIVKVGQHTFKLSL